MGKIVLNRKQKAWLIAGLSFVMVMGMAAVVWVDFGAIKEEENRIAAVRSEISAADATIAGLKRVEDRVLTERLRVKEYTNILPLDKEINNFVDRITEFEALSGVEIEALDDKVARDRNKRKSREAFVRINYKLDLLATVDQFLHFLDLFESYDRFVRVTSIDLKGGDAEILDDGTEMPARHKVVMEIETYVYNPKNRLENPVKIMGAEERIALMAESGDVVSELELETYGFEPSTRRRDPFANPRKSLQREGEDEGTSIEDQKRILAELETELAELLEWCEREESEQDMVVRFELTRRIDERAAALNKRLVELDPATYFSASEYLRKYEEGIARPFAAFLEARPNAEGLDLPLQELETQLEKLRSDFGESDWEAVVALNQTLQTSRPSQAPEKMTHLYDEAKALADRAQIRLDFAKIELSIDGFVLPRNEPSRSVVIINGRAYSRGERFDEVLIVQDVRSDAVEFDFKGERIVRAID